MTVNSFISVTLEPLTIAVCVNHEASIATMLTVPGQLFSISILGQSQQDIAQACANKPDGEQRFKNPAWTQDKSQTPYLSEGLGTLFCQQSASYRHGTHSLIIGEVQMCQEHDQECMLNPLLYYNMAYARLRSETK